MLFSFKFLVAAVSMMPLVLPAAAAHAQQPAAGSHLAAGNGGAEVVPKPVIGVIDLQQILSTATAARKVATQREKYLNVYQAQVADQEKALRDADQELNQQRATLSPDELNRRRSDFQQRVGAFQREVEGRRRNLERAYAQAMNEIQVSVIRHTREQANARGMNMVIYRSQVFLFDPVIDITDEVLADVNRELTSVVMPDPETLPPAREGR